MINQIKGHLHITLLKKLQAVQKEFRKIRTFYYKNISEFF